MSRMRTTKPEASGGIGAAVVIGASVVALFALAVPPAWAQQPDDPAAAEEAVAEEAPAPEGEVELPALAIEGPAEPAEGAPEEVAEEPPAPPVVAVTIAEDEVAARITEAYGVDVLQVKRQDLAPDAPAYAVKVMKPRGASTMPFQVTTLMVDAATGELIPQFRHQPSGYQRSGTFSAAPSTDADGTVLRSWTFRPRPESAR